ncbi:hypothetical protein LINPERHAP2_LOCUS553 [Linum perenne]
MMEHEKSGCGVKADPNIISRVKTLKAKFLAMQELRGLSGAGWDDTLKMVDIPDTVYEEYVALVQIYVLVRSLVNKVVCFIQNHHHCAKLNRVSFPCYDGLAYVFDKVRATGKGAVGPEELERDCPPIDVPNKMLLRWNSEYSNIGTKPNEQPNRN